MKLLCNRIKSGGQVMVEMIVIMIFILVPLAFIILELGQYISLQVRMSSAAREAGRLTLSNNIIPLDGVTYNAADARTDFNNEVYSAIKQMVTPSDFDDDKGVVYISILRRSDDGSSTAPGDTKITIEEQFVFGDTSFVNFPSNPKPSPLYGRGEVFDGNSADKIIEPIALEVSERTVLIELFHPLTFTDAVNGLLSNTSGWNYVYDYALF